VATVRFRKPRPVQQTGKGRYSRTSSVQVSLDALTAANRIHQSGAISTGAARTLAHAARVGVYHRLLPKTKLGRQAVHRVNLAKARGHARLQGAATRTYDRVVNPSRTRSGNIIQMRRGGLSRGGKIALGAGAGAAATGATVAALRARHSGRTARSGAKRRGNVRYLRDSQGRYAGSA